MAELNEKTAEEIRKLLAAKKIVVGSERTIKQIKTGGIARVFVTLNAKPSTKESLLHYCKMGNVEVVELPVKSAELGIVCKKPFSISVLGVVKK